MVQKVQNPPGYRINCWMDGSVFLDWSILQKFQVNFWNLGNLATNDKQNLLDFAYVYLHYCCMVTTRDSQSKYD